MASGLSRVTIVGPRSRADVALPSHVPMADLLPTLLGFATEHGEPAPDPAARHGWSIARLGGGALDTSCTPAQLEVRDGELLYLRPASDEAPVAVFDDLVDALATGTQSRGSRWTTATTRRFGLTTGVVALVGGAAAIPFAGSPSSLGGVIGLGLAEALLVVAAVFARALGDRRAALAFALVSTVYAGTGGLLILAGDQPLADLGPAHLLVAATAIILATVVAGVSVPGAAPVFLGTGIVAGAGLLTAVIAAVFDATPAAAAAITATATYATLPALPMLAYRMVGLPVPTLPSQRADLRQDTDTVDGSRVLGLSHRADAYLAAMVAALAVISAATALLVAFQGVAGLAFATVLGILPLLRARWFAGQAQRLPLAIAGVAALATVAVALFVAVDQTLRLAGIFAATIAVGAVSIAFGLTGGSRQGSPVWGRVLDLLEILFILALAPLAVWVSGLYSWIRAIRG